MSICKKSASLILIRDDYKVLMLERTKKSHLEDHMYFQEGFQKKQMMKWAKSLKILLSLNSRMVLFIFEETNIQLDYKQLYQKIKPFLRIITPQMMQKRYDTQFFVQIQIIMITQTSIKLKVQVMNGILLMDFQKNLLIIKYSYNHQYSYNYQCFNNKEAIKIQLIILIQEINIKIHILMFSNFVRIYQFFIRQQIRFNYPDPNYNLQELMETEQTDYLKSELKVKYNLIEGSDFRFELEANQKKLTGHIRKFKNSPLALLNGQIINDSQFIKYKAKL